ncbi:ABC transporter permease [Pseudomonas sp. 13B_2.1_Bac1]|uniref:ABC transporter permease n=1 Tax=Pseudomonas sp. 13B_2.1_Bac1 TaxID=2971624 RepID=UPI0021C7C0BE|nr:ABC transporter permease [Pseudomonas sp. 13B_2.1_Bac1]MCU1785271.1 ABC transporter permease [Pseudomonas sp. 13B_2.1_Bac1]
MNPLALRRLRRGLTLPALLLFIWWTVYAFGLTDSTLFVAPDKVLDAAFGTEAGAAIWQTLAQSLLRGLSGLIIGTSLGLLFGVLLGVSRRAERFFALTLHSIKQVSLFAWLPLLSLWFGFGESSKLAFIAWAAFFPVLLNTFEGVSSVPRELVDVARVSGFSRWQMFSRLLMPAALPSLFNGFYLALVFSWLATLGAEYMLGSGDGMGVLLMESRAEMRMDLMLLGIVLVGAVGFALDIAAKALERYLLRWREPV